ncbi:pantoate--beta-alanine ligase [Intrasporangium chromatireducens Q5-1]|uniref:Pantothenate synthetase n=1 Tax=Intrasporangium chromatireducens Q5-1 TaxID=584657 RepID=W9GJ95_9MICO|nr:pantoate--beta-alanine ligase [Intrasporangium chromatireducens]EWT06155.1 pantoate--beta-alanine ligase [Intrasporangium chromatireducens Q5-1]
MHVVRSREQARRARAGLGSVGFVPTMGFLHDGHLSLVEVAGRGHDAVAVSIFVNPTQFGPGEDFAAYPRDLDRDLAVLESAGVDLVWVPDVADIYPRGAATRVTVDGPIASVLEGASRPGHFDGVATVVTILLGVLAPTGLVLGAKDAQQVTVLRSVVRDLGLDVELIVGPTWREPDGLAMSSRNIYLTEPERAAAPVLRRALAEAEARYAAGLRDAALMRSVVRELVRAEPLAELDYVSVADPDTLAELEWIDDTTQLVDPERKGRGAALVSLAARFGRARLLDNVTLGA